MKVNKIKISPNRLKKINRLNMEVERLILLRDKTENEIEKNEIEDIIQNLQEVLIKEIWFDLQTSNDEIKSMHELNSKLQNEIELFKVELAKEKNEKDEIIKDEYSLYEKLRLLEQNKTESKSSYEFIINQLRGELDILKTDFTRLYGELDAQKSKNNELQSSINVQNVNLKDLEFEYATKLNGLKEDREELEEKVKYLEKTNEKTRNELNAMNEQNEEIRQKYEEISISLKSLIEAKTGLDLHINELNEKILILEKENLKKDFLIKKHACLMDGFDKFYDQYLDFIQKLTENQDLKLVDQKKDEDFLYENIVLCPMELKEKLENSPSKLLKRKSPEKDPSNESSTSVNVRCVKKISQRSNLIQIT